MIEMIEMETKQEVPVITTDRDVPEITDDIKDAFQKRWQVNPVHLFYDVTCHVCGCKCEIIGEDKGKDHDDEYWEFCIDGWGMDSGRPICFDCRWDRKEGGK